MANQVVLEDHEHSGKKGKLVDVEAMHGNCLRTTLGGYGYGGNHRARLYQLFAEAGKAVVLQTRQAFVLLC